MRCSTTPRRKTSTIPAIGLSRYTAYSRRRQRGLDSRKRVEHRRREQPDLHQHRHREPDVARTDLHGGKQQPETDDESDQHDHRRDHPQRVAVTGTRYQTSSPTRTTEAMLMSTRAAAT